MPHGEVRCKDVGPCCPPLARDGAHKSRFAPVARPRGPLSGKRARGLAGP